MVMNIFLDSHQSSRHCAVSGHWPLWPGRAVSLLPRELGVLRIVQGQVWATLDGSGRGPVTWLGDHFLQVGQELVVPAGQHLVFESYGAASETPVYFDWIPQAAADAVATSRWQQTIVQPLHDLGLALRMAGGALGRLVKGLAGYGEYVVAGRGRVMPKLEANQP